MQVSTQFALFALLCTLLSLQCEGFAPASSTQSFGQQRVTKERSHSPSSPSSSSLNLLPFPLPSLLAGSIAGAVGVGAAFPLDTIKTKSQVFATASSAEKPIILPDGRLCLPPADSNDLLQVSSYIYQTQGLAGFFGGVQTSMVGQAIIKAVVFAVNSYMTGILHEQGILPENMQLIVAAASAGFVTSFLASPVDRIKVLMQASGDRYMGKEDQAIQAVLGAEGWKGLMSRGLPCTMLREIPAYTLYFGVYGGLQQYFGTEVLGPWAPLVYGALAGMACWVPIYPIDVIKTVIQNTEGSESQASIPAVARELYAAHGPSVFWDGITPRLLRQAVNHAVTFALYDALMNQLFVK